MMIHGSLTLALPLILVVASTVVSERNRREFTIDASDRKNSPGKSLLLRLNNIHIIHIT